LELIASYARKVGYYMNSEIFTLFAVLLHLVTYSSNCFIRTWNQL